MGMMYPYNMNYYQQNMYGYPPFMYFGGGEADVKICCNVSEFIQATKCYVTDVIHDGFSGDDISDEEL